MPIIRCRVSFVDSEGTDHAVEVEAESMYDAIGLAMGSASKPHPAKYKESLLREEHRPKGIEYFEARIALGQRAINLRPSLIGITALLTAFECAIPATP